MRIKAFIPVIFLVVLAVICISGCKLSTTVIVEEDNDVRIVNRSGNKVRMRWDEGSYYYIDDGDSIYVPADDGYYELEWVEASSGRYNKPAKVFRIDIEMDIDIVFQDDDPDIIIIER